MYCDAVYLFLHEYISARKNSDVPNSRVGWNKRVGWKFAQKTIIVLDEINV